MQPASTWEQIKMCTYYTTGATHTVVCPWTVGSASYLCTADDEENTARFKDQILPNIQTEYRHTDNVPC